MVTKNFHTVIDLHQTFVEVFALQVAAKKVVHANMAETRLTMTATAGFTAPSGSNLHEMRAFTLQ